MDTNLYWNVRGTYEERKKKLSELSKEYLEAAIIDSEYNDFLSSRADYKEDSEDKHGHGKRLPYIGWYWRHINFSDLTDIPIGDCGEFIGFMANNKWDYDERNLTEDEAKTIISFIDEAMKESQQGGVVSEIIEKTNSKLDLIWDYMQTLSI